LKVRLPVLSVFWSFSVTVAAASALSTALSDVLSRS